VKQEFQRLPRESGGTGGQNHTSQTGLGKRKKGKHQTGRGGDIKETPAKSRRNFLHTPSGTEAGLVIGTAETRSLFPINGEKVGTQPQSCPGGGCQKTLYILPKGKGGERKTRGCMSPKTKGKLRDLAVVQGKIGEATHDL